MDLFALHVFCSLGTTLNYKKTADELHITQPAVSYHIKSLEADLGVQLLERNKHRTELTPAGREFLYLAENMCEQERFAKARMRQISEGGAGQLTIAGIQTYLHRISKAEAVFSSRYPNIRIDTFMMDGPDLLHSCKFSEYDIYFGAENMIREHADYKTEAICTDSMELFYPSFLHSELISLKWKNLENIPFISIAEKNYLLYKRSQLIMNDFEFHPVHINYCTTIESILSLIDAGCGISLLPSVSDSEHRYRNVLSIPLSHEASSLTMKVSWRTAANYSLTSRFIQILKSLLEDCDSAV
ncbi:MAG: LysR family transcriptional regulator [Clostridia bacterium]|nr:LysR family transcriptional regulator [Clostridia bacterium]